LVKTHDLQTTKPALSKRTKPEPPFPFPIGRPWLNPVKTSQIEKIGLTEFVGHFLASACSHLSAIASATADRPLAILSLLLLAGCHQQSAPPNPTDPRSVYATKGVIQSIEPDGKTVIIQHDAISNYMPAMTMPFAVKDAKELRGLQSGDSVSFRLVVAPHDGWIENVAKLSSALPAIPTPPPAMAPAQIQISRAVAELSVGEKIPDYHLTNELGQPVTIGASPGEVFAFTFFFTRCPFPTACPLLADNFAAAQAKLALAPGAPPLWHLFSISFDPANDTPAVLQEYARQHQADPARWSFLTGSLEDITELADQFGEEFQNDGHTITHSFRTVVVDANGRVRRIFPGNTWTSEDLVREVLKADKSN
jgi:protein SCO1/2